MNNSQEIFTSIYHNNGFGSTESKSGPGSTLEQTEKLRSSIIDVIHKYKIQTVTDFPCGDLNWISHIFDSIEGYTGCDIVNDCIDINKSKYPNKNFSCLDLSSDPIPSSDLLLVRDVVGHQPLEVGAKMIDNILKSNCTYLLSTTWANYRNNSWSKCNPGEVHRENEGVEFGSFFPVNLMAPPFNFPEPLEYIEEDVVVDNYHLGNRKSLCLWKIEDIKNFLSKETIKENKDASSSNLLNSLEPNSHCSDLTIVSGLWDIHRVGRKWEQYLEHFIKFLKIPCNLILWIPADLESLVWEHRSTQNTFVKIYELEDIKTKMFSPFWDKWQLIRENPDWQSQSGWLPESPQCKNEFYNPIVMSKMFFLHDSKIFNPFNTDYFIWLDAGITQTVYENYFYDPKILKNLTKYLNPFLFLSYPYKGAPEIHGFEINAINNYAGTEVDYVCRGGLFGGHKDFISEANSEYYSLLNTTLSSGHAGTEESLFAVLAKLHPSKYRRYELDGNGLIVKFIQALDSDTVSLAEIPTNEKPKEVITNDLSNVKTNLYFLTFNYPDQLEFTINSLKKHDNFLDLPQQKILIDNSTNEEARKGNAIIAEKYGFEHIIRNKNTGICGGRQFAAEHFDSSDADFYLFFEDDMTISDPDEGLCRNGFKKYVPNLYVLLHKIMLKEQYDFLKLSYTEVYMDNNIQVSWYNVPQTVRDSIWPHYNQLPSTGLDPNAPRTEFSKIETIDGTSYIEGEIYYANWPHITSREGNKKMFLNTKWARPFEQTWMSHIFQETKKGNIKPAILLASPVTHDRFKHYSAEERVES
jgi:hypothetical protein